MMTTSVLSSTQPSSISQAAALLRAGKAVAFPTDTVYGVGTILDAAEQLYNIKQRSLSKSIPILLATADDLKLVTAEVSEPAGRLGTRFWPGPLTLVLPKSSAVPQSVSRTPTVAVRIPDHPLALALIAATGEPLAVTSANLTGKAPTVDPAVVLRSLGGRMAALLDGGLAPGGTPSTVVDVTIWPPRILRPGPISLEEILVTTGKCA